MSRSIPSSPGKTADKRKTSRGRGRETGLSARQAAVGLLGAVLRGGQPLDEALVSSRAGREMAALPERDRAFARAIAGTALRRKGQIDAVLARFVEKGLPKRAGGLREILLAGACQILFLETPDHAAVDLAVRQCQQDRQARHFDKLANAVLHRVAREGAALVAAQDAGRTNTPDWLWSRWENAYGADTARRIAAAHLEEAPLDLTVKSNPEGWAERLGGVSLPTGSVRILPKGRIEAMEGFGSGQWWVQDAAAALPARLLGEVSGKRVADLCAAPGGKTAQLVHAGGRVTAIDDSPIRLARLQENLKRLGLAAEVVTGDATAWTPAEKFDAVLLDAPCLGTGTIRRHPDIPYLKSAGDLAELTALQARLLAHAVSLTKPGGVLVYCTCSLEPEEGEAQIERLLSTNVPVFRDPVRAEELAGQPDWITGAGYLRTMPFGLPSQTPGMGGMDGFFAARLRITG